MYMEEFAHDFDPLIPSLHWQLTTSSHLSQHAIHAMVAVSFSPIAQSLYPCYDLMKIPD